MVIILVDHELETMLRQIGRVVPATPMHVSKRAVHLGIARKSKGRRLRIATVVAGLVGISGLTTTAVADPNFLTAIAKFTHVSNDSQGYITGFTFGSGGPDYDDSSPDGKNINEPGYTATIENEIGHAYPRLNDSGLNVFSVQLNIANRAAGHYDLQADALVTNHPSADVILYSYHNLIKMPVFNGQTIGSNVDELINLNDTKATYLNYTAPRSQAIYIAWKRGGWTMVLLAKNLGRADAVNIATDIDHQAQKFS
jgi:hypothetical protein